MLELIKLLPDLAKGGAWLVLAAVLIFILFKFLELLKAQDASHREERSEQNGLHQEAMEKLMETHSQERKEWVGKIEAAADKHARAMTDQGDRIARALEDALRRSRSK